MITKELYEQGINCRGMCFLCDKVNSCYQAKVNGEKERVKKVKYEFEVENIGQISDGSHTFDELYYHRMVLFSVICNTYKDKAWKSWKHDDGTMFDDYFIVGVSTLEGQYTYHYHKDYWNNFHVRELPLAPKWDGHEPKDVTRLLSLVYEREISND